jgi:Uma2 family endonuclease
MSVQPVHRYTPEEYLVLEETAAHKSEYLNGIIYAMAGSTPSHALITVNAGAELRTHLRPKRCRVYSSDLRLKVEATGLFTYPDLSVICEPERYAEGIKARSLLNPLLIVEVLSDSTERYDRGIKFHHYRQIPSLKEYVLISQNAPHVESYLRQDDEKNERWTLTIATGMEAHLELQSVGITLALSDIYDNVVLPPELTLSNGTETVVE